MSILSIFNGASDGPKVDRVRHEPRRRSLSIVRSEHVTPGTLRLTLSGPDLAGFRSDGFDDHLKVFVPDSGDRRDYTPRRFDPAAGTLAIDFAIHEGGAVTDWALSARPGDTVDVSGPKSSTIVSPDVRRWLLVGDESALPAIGRHVEEAEPGVEITTIAAVTGPEMQQAWRVRAQLISRWAHRPLALAADPASLLALVRDVELYPDTFVWVAAEANVARTVRDHLVRERGHRRGWLKAGGYWVKGRAGGKERLG